MMEEDLGKIVKKERRRFSKRRREIRKDVQREMLELVERKVASFREYLARWCGGPEKEGEEAPASQRETL